MKIKSFFNCMVFNIIFFIILFSCARKTTILLSKRVLPSVVLINVYDSKGQYYGCGSGFFIDKSGLIVTNRHVIVRASKIEIKIHTGEILNIDKILAEEQSYDLALISVKLPSKMKIRPLKLTKKIPKVGEKIVVVGNPFGLEQTVSEGIISAIREIEGFGKIIQITAPVSAGSSGSPVVNLKGEVIGVASFQIIGGQNLNFAIPFNKILEIRQSIQTAVAKGKDFKKFSSKITVLKFRIYSWFSTKVALKLCEKLVKDKKYEVALLCYKTLADKKSKDAQIFYNIGKCYEELKDYIQAEKYYKSAIELKPDNAQFYKVLGNLYYKQAKYEEAVKVYEEVLKLLSDDVNVYIDLALIYIKLKRNNKAINYLNKALKIKPDYDEIYYVLGCIYHLSNQLDKANYYYKECLRLNPENDKATFNFGGICMHRGEIEKAIVYFTKAAQLNPNCADLSYHCIGLAYYTKILQRRIETIKLAIEVLEDLYLFGRTHRNIQKVYDTDDMKEIYKKAIEAFENSIKIRESKSEPTFSLLLGDEWWKHTYHYLGVCYLEINEVGLAIEQYKKLKDIDKELAEMLFNEIYK